MSTSVTHCLEPQSSSCPLGEPLEEKNSSGRVHSQRRLKDRAPSELLNSVICDTGNDCFRRAVGSMGLQSWGLTWSVIRILCQGVTQEQKQAMSLFVPPASDRTYILQTKEPSATAPSQTSCSRTESAICTHDNFICTHDDLSSSF